MKRRYQAPPSNPVQICFCCAGNLISKEWNKIPYQDRMKFTFVPRYINPDANGRLPLRYCPKCEAQRCENMPGRNHHHLFLYVANAQQAWVLRGPTPPSRKSHQHGERTQGVLLETHRSFPQIRRPTRPTTAGKNHQSPRIGNSPP